MYESFYGLTAKPFQLSPDPGFFFDSRGHRRALSYLEYGLHQGEGFIVVTGEVGAGKTTIVRRMLEKLPAKDIVPVQVVSTQLGAEDLLRLIAGSFGIATEALDKGTVLLRLEAFLRRLHADGKRALLIVDEAQNLSPRAIEELRMLSNFQVGPQAMLQSFLVGQPELRQLMQRPEMRQLRQRVLAAYHLGPIEPGEVQHYVEHRLRQAGWHDDPSFETAVFAALHDCTGGLPRRINTLADRLLLAGFLAESHRITARDVRQVAAEMADELGAMGATAPASPPRLDPFESLDTAVPSNGPAVPGAAAPWSAAPADTAAMPLPASFAHVPATALDDAACPPLAGDAAPLGAPIASDGALLAQRVAAVESSTSTIQDALRRVMHLVRLLQGDRKPGLRSERI